MAKRMAKQLVVLKGRVDQWREEKKGRRSRIPESLWSDAVVVALTAGVSQTSRATGFAYGDLKKRVALAPEPAELPKPEFVSIKMPEVAQDTTVAVELTRADGSKMRIETDTTQLNVQGMVESFLRTIG